MSNLAQDINLFDDPRLPSELQDELHCDAALNNLSGFGEQNEKVVVHSSHSALLKK
jgi:hypothetical protein